MSQEGATLWRQQRDQEQDRKQKELQSALTTAGSDEDKQAAEQAIYGPGEMKQRAENLIGRLVGRKPQPVVSPTAAAGAPTLSVKSQQGAFTNPDTGEAVSSGQPLNVTGKGLAPRSRQEALAQIATRGNTTPAQQNTAAYQQYLKAGFSPEEASQMVGVTYRTAKLVTLSSPDGQQKQTVDANDPATKELLSSGWTQVANQSGTTRQYKSPDGKSTNWFVPGEEPEGWNATQGNAAPRVIQLAGPDGKPFYGTESGGKFYDAAGKEVPDAKPFVKPGAQSPKAGTSNGQNVYAVLTPNGWMDTNTNQIIRDFRPMPTFSQTGLYGLEPFQNADGTMTSALMNRRTGEFKVLSSANGAPISPQMLTQVNKSIEPAFEADTRYRVMKDSEQKALQGDQQAALNILANHLGMTQGIQKGSRITQTVMDEAIASAPFLGRFLSRAFHKDPTTGDYIFDGYKTGVTLTSEQIEQMMSLAQDRRMRQWQQAQQAGTMYGVNVPIPDDLQKPGNTLNAPAPRKSAAPPQASTPRQPAPQSGNGAWAVPADAPPAPKQDGKVLKADGKVIAVSKGGQWTKPNGQ
jgi:hypothetical protein